MWPLFCYFKSLDLVFSLWISQIGSKYGQFIPLFSFIKVWDQDACMKRSWEVYQSGKLDYFSSFWKNIKFSVFLFFHLSDQEEVKMKFWGKEQKFCSWNVFALILSFCKTSASHSYFNFYLSRFLQKNIHCTFLWLTLFQLNYQDVHNLIIWHLLIMELSAVKVRMTRKLFQKRCHLRSIPFDMILDKFQISSFVST